MELYRSTADTCVHLWWERNVDLAADRALLGHAGDSPGNEQMSPIHSQNNGQIEPKPLKYEILQLLNSLVVHLLKGQNKVQIKNCSLEEYS